MGVKAIIAGSRHYSDKEKLFQMMDGIHSYYSIEVVLSGGQTGADTLGEQWARSRGIPVDPYYPKKEIYGIAAFPIRNEEMAKVGDIAVLFGDGKGTRDMRKKANNRNLKIITYK